MNVKIAIILTMVGLVGCATTPAQPAPSLFQGRAPILPVGKVKVTNKVVLDSGDVILESVVQHGRTGTLLNEISLTKSYSLVAALDGKAKIPAGSKVYALEFEASNNRAPHSIGWCVPSYSRWLGIKGKPIPSCAFWNAAGYVEYLEGQTNQSLFFAPNLNEGAISSGDAPQIREEEVDLGVELTMKVIFKKIDRKNYDIELRLLDGSGEYLIRNLNLEKAPDNSASLNMWGKKLLISPVSDEERKKIKIEVFE